MVRAARTDLRQLVAAQRAAESEAAAAEAAAASAKQVGDFCYRPVLASATMHTSVARCFFPSAHLLNVPAVCVRFSLQDSQTLQQQQQTGWKPRVGQTVFVPRLNQAAKVVKVAGSGAITLQAGILKVTVTADEIRQR